MVALHAAFYSPISSSQTPFPSATAARSPAALSAISHPRPKVCSSLMDFGSKPPTFKPLKPSRCLMIVCSSTGNSPSRVVAETGISSFLLGEIGLGNREIELLADKNPAIRLASYESLRTQIESLQVLGVIGIALCRLIIRRPDVLTAPEIGPLLKFIRDDLEGKIEAAQLRQLLAAAEPRLLAGFDSKSRLLLQCGIPREKLPHVLNNVNLTRAICLKSAEEIQRTMAYLDRFGGANIIIRRPSILNYDLDAQLVPRIRFLTELSGGDEDAAGAVLRRLPAVLAYSVEHMEDHVEFLRSFAGLTTQQIFRIVLVFPNVFSASRKRKLHPRIDFLKQCGLDSNDIYKFLIKAPLFLGLSFEDNLACKLSFLVKIGYKYQTKELASAMGAVTRTSCENLQKIIELFLSHGLSYEDIFAMSTKHPQILQYNHQSLEEKMEYLIEKMGRDIEELLAFPAFLGYKLDDRIKQRYEARKRIVGEGMSINKLLSVSAKRFARKQEMKSVVVND